MRTARSTRWRTCAGARGLLNESSPATSLNSESEVDFLLVVAADRGARLLADDGQHRLMVEPRVVETGDQVRRARAGGRDAHPELARELGMGGGHERGHFLVPRLDEFDLRRLARFSAPNTPLMPSPG